MSDERKPSSPLKDSLRIFIRNKPAVFAMVMILVLAAVAVTGEYFVGKKPDEKQLELIERADKVGDEHSLDVNPDAVLDPVEPTLEDYFLPPFSKSRIHDDKMYWLGTDHLGRDVLARLWSGSSISLTIGFLAVGISLLLGISLGGIAGFYGRSRVLLPLLATLVFAIAAGIAWAAEFPALAVPFAVLAGGFFVLQCVVAVIGKRYKAVIAFGVALLLSAGVYFYTSYVENNVPEGRIYTQASLVEEQAQDLIRDMRDLGREVRKMEDGLPDAPSEEWQREKQVAIEVTSAQVQVEVARFAVIEHEAQVEMAERLIPEREERIEYLKEIEMPEMAEQEASILEADQQRLEAMNKKTEELNKQLEEAEKALEEVQGKEASEFELQNSNQLLERRANFRQQVFDQFMAKRTTAFEELVGAKLISGHDRYGVYRILRHLITVIILALLLVVTALVVAGEAQAAVADTDTPLNKLFLPTINVDDLVMRFTEIMMTIPVIYLILMVLALFERDVYVVMAIIGLTSWMGTTRFVRAEILSLREQDFIQAARSLGIPDYRIIWRHLVPNAISPVLVSATLGVATAVLTESTLSFLGIGAGPNQDTWGKILAEGRQYMLDASWLIWIPGIAILITVLSFNLLGEGLREAFNPKLRGR